MDFILKLFIIPIFSVIIVLNSNAQLVINEFMQSNIDCMMDDFNEYPDSWVELYNISDTPVEIGAFSLGIKDSSSKSFRLPDFNLSPKEHIVIFCDKEGLDFHTDFRLESGKGGSIYLFEGEKIIDCITDIPKMPAPNISFGRETDGSDNWGYQLISTPGQANCHGLSNEILPNPLFSIPGGVMNSSVDLIISIPENTPEGTIIRFTTDCSEPTDNSQIFTDPITISTTTIIRAKLFCDGYLSPRSLTHSYIYHYDEMTLPIVSVVTDSENLYDEEIGILSDGLPDAKYKNWEYNWRRPINIEYFTSNETPAAVNQLCETRLKGSTSRYYPIKSMVVYANKRFGTKRLETEFFPEQRPGITDFKSIELRNGGQDFYRMYMRDALVQSTMGENVDIDWQAYQPAVVYLNGTYHAMLNIRERANEDNIYTHYEGLEDIDMIENLKEVNEGSIDNFLSFKSLYSEQGHSYEEFCELMDMNEFINYFIMQVYFANCDFPGNNHIMWRPIEEGGKWRWICKDLDTTLGFITKYDFPYFDWLYHPEKYPEFNWANDKESSLLFTQLLSIPKFLEEFTSRIAVYMGDFMQAERIIERLERMAETIAYEHSINYEKNVVNGIPFDLSVEITKNHLSQRNVFLYNHIADFFNLGKPVPIVIECDDNSVETLSLNDIALKSLSFNGCLYPTTPLILKLSHTEGSLSSVINVTILDKECKSETKSINSNELTLELPIEGRVHISISNHSSSVDEIHSDSLIDFNLPYDIYSLDGIQLKDNSIENLRRGIYIIRQGDKTYKYSK